EVDVVRDQRLSRANHSGACGWMEPGFTEVRIAIGVCANLVSKRFELPAADIFKVPSFRTSSGCFIQVNGNVEPARNLAAGIFCNLHAVGERNSANGNERDRSEEHTSELQSRFDLVCRLL